MDATTPTLDARNTIPARLEKIGMSQGVFAKLCGTNKAEFSRMLNGLKPMSGSQTAEFYRMLDAVEEMVKLFSPLKPSLDEADAIREWLRSPSLPNLFALLSDAQLAQLKPSELTAANALLEKSEKESQKLESEIAALHEATRKMFGEWLENPTV
jgi:hypothetical protein